jgi:hypothetical protein
MKPVWRWALSMVALAGCSSGSIPASDAGIDAGREPSVIGHDPCDPELSLAQPGPMVRPLRLAGGGRAFVELRRNACAIELISAPSLESLATLTLADPECRVTATAGDADADGIDELYVEVREHYDEADPTRPHDVWAVVLELPTFRERWRSETIRTFEYHGFDFSSPPDDFFSFNLDADGDCNVDII